MSAIALTIAGSDSGGGAGIQADLKTFSALGVYGASVITALTAQNTRGVQAIHPVPPAFVAAQIDSVLSDLAVGAIKIGMLASPDVIEAVAAALDRHAPRPLVLDPVMVAQSGDRLVPPDAVEALRRVLLPRALIVTPNLPEAAVLAGGGIAESEGDMADQGETIRTLGARHVLMKGGHAEGSESVDWLIGPAGRRRYAAPRLASRNTHGTGCTLSSAIAAGLARGLPLEEAVGAAKAYVHRAIGAAARLEVGSGHGPTHHFHAWW